MAADIWGLDEAGGSHRVRLELSAMGKGRVWRGSGSKIAMGFSHKEYRVLVAMGKHVA